LNLHCERGDYVLASIPMLRDAEAYPLRNEIWRILEIETNFDTMSINYLLQDTGAYQTTDGSTRDRRILC
jgi:hypothetical protein